MISSVVRSWLLAAVALVTVLVVAVLVASVVTVMATPPPEPAPVTCVACHTHPDAQHVDCQTCHAEWASCDSCHTPHPWLGHTDCDLCHDPHAPSWKFTRDWIGNKNADVCQSCHSTGAHSHPIDQAADEYPPADRTWDPYLEPPEGPDHSGTRLWDSAGTSVIDTGSGYIKCSTCHVAHGAVQGSGLNSMAYIDAASSNSPLCQNCHGWEEGPPPQPPQPPQPEPPLAPPPGSGMSTIYGTKHDLGSPNDPTCAHCHLPHNAQGDYLWAMSPVTGMSGLQALCFSCHDGTVTPLGAFILDPNYETHTVSPTGEPPPTWDEDCGSCHSIWVDDWGDDVMDDWGDTGHGKTTGNYAASNNSAADFPGAAGDGNACLYCHDSSVPHGSGTNPFRLANTTGAGVGQNENCSICHRDSSPGYDPDDVGPMEPWNATVKVDSSHYGSEHLAANNGGQFCWDCHDPHGGQNVGMIHDSVAKTSDTDYGRPISTVATEFATMDTWGSYVNNSDFDGICQVCHTTTSIFTGNTNYDPGHNPGHGCTSCHTHDSGFAASGGDCLSCHAGSQESRQAINPGDWGISSHGASDDDLMVNGCLACHDETETHKDGSLQLTTEHSTEVYTETNMDQLCLDCHTEGMVQNDALSGPTLADDIEQAFDLGVGDKHDLGTSFDIGSETFTLQCTSCHNPHVVTGKHWDVATPGVSPITRPDFSDPTGNPRAMGTTLWGDESGEKMDDYAGGGTYRTPYGDTFTGAQLPDYDTFCLDCHEPMPDPGAQAGAHGQIQFSGDPHGLNSANVPDNGALVPNWYTAGKAVGWDGDNSNNTWPAIPRGRGEIIWTRAPYSQEERIAGINFVLSCTDCHEAHGSDVARPNGSAGSMIRSKLNDLNDSGTVIWNSSCNACHYYYSDFHKGMSCGNASCHNQGDRMSDTGTDTLHRMGFRSGDSSTRIFDPDLVVDMRFEGNLKDSSSYRLDGVWSLYRPGAGEHDWCSGDPAGQGTYETGRFGQAIQINNQPVEVGTEDCDWSTADNSYTDTGDISGPGHFHPGHGTWKYTEMKDNMTLEAWVYPTDDAGSERKIMAKHTYWDGGYALVLKKIDGTWRAGLLTNIDGGGPTGDWDPEVCNGLRGAYSNVSIPLNQWTHVAATYDLAGPDRDAANGSVGRIRIYVNGEDVTTSLSNVSSCYAQPGPGEDAMFPNSDHNITDPDGWYGSALSIGGLNWSDTNNNFIGRLDEAKVWNVTKDAAYFALADAQSPPRIDKVLGMAGSDELRVTFSEGVYSNTSPPGDLQPSDFTLTDNDNGRTIDSVAHTAGDNAATLTLSSRLDCADDILVDTVAAASNSIYDEYDNPAGTDPVTIMLSEPMLSGCPEGETSFQLDEPAGSLCITDDSGLLVGTVGNPAFAFPGDGYFHGDEGQNTYIDVDNNPTCLNSPRAITIEARVKPTEVDRGVGDNTFNRIFERRRTILVTILNTNYRGDDIPERADKASIEVKYRVDSASRHTCPDPQWPDDPYVGNDVRMHQISSDIDQWPIVNDHWYLIKVVFNSDKQTEIPGSDGTPVDIFIDDQGPNGDDVGENWSGYVNASKTINESSSCKWGALPGDFIESRSDTSHIGSSWNHNQLFEGLIDWVTWQPVSDYSGVDDPPY